MIDNNAVISTLAFICTVVCQTIYKRNVITNEIVSTATNGSTASLPLNSSSSSDNAYLKLIGNTPLIRLNKLSSILRCNILVKMESMNPGGTGKDRASKYMLQAAIDNSKVKINRVVEGTSGSTGIALACLCKGYDLQLYVVMPDDQANEKKDLLEKLGCIVKIVPCCSISNENHYVNVAKRLATEIDAVFLDQFDNVANYNAHYHETGPEIWTQTNGSIDAFVMSSGTGGTIAGVSNYLKEMKPSIKVYLADPEGSSLFNRVKYGVCYTSQQSERTIKKHRYDTIVEGVGLDRVTRNFELAKIDDGERVTDQEIIEMAHFLLKEEGLFVGSSSALNIVATCKIAKKMGCTNHLLSSDSNDYCNTIVTVVCDSGQRHLSRFWNEEYIKKYNLTWPDKDTIPQVLLNMA